MLLSSLMLLLLLLLLLCANKGDKVTHHPPLNDIFACVCVFVCSYTYVCLYVHAYVRVYNSLLCFLPLVQRHYCSYYREISSQLNA